MSYDLDELLKTCAEEKIQFIGEIQEFACLIAIDKNFEIKALSENATFLAPFKLGANLSEYYSKEDLTRLDKFIAKKDFTIDYSIFLGEEKTNFYCYKSNDLIVLEHEFMTDESNPVQKESLISSLTGFSLSGKNHETSLRELAQVMSENIKNLIGYDRVMIYKFHPDNHGEVIAEAKEDYLEPFIGLHYPESDIPKQARELFVRNQIRLISNINGKRIPLLKLDDKLELDLSDSISRAASIVHIEYLKNMKVGASLSISITVDGKLWGLIACHHYKDRFISFANRSFLKLVGFSFAAEVSKSLSQRLNERIKRVNMITVSFIDKISTLKGNFDQSFLDKVISFQSENLLSLQEANGLYIKVGNSHSKIGQVPRNDVISFVEDKISNNEESPFFTTDSLSKLDPKFMSISKECSGVLAAGIVSKNSKCIVMWFRPETLQEIKWAGKDDKQVVYDGDQPRLSPRGSFDEITRLNKNTSLAFNEQDETVAFEFLWFLNKVLLEQLRFIESTITNLERQANEKDKFISNLSHELRTPLNNILGWLQLFSEELSANEQLAEFADVVEKNSNQQLKLVNDLLEISKISTGKIQLDLKASDIRQSIKNVCRYFEPSFDAKNIECFQSLGTKELTCSIDETRFEQILRNILQNSLKFTPKGGEIFIKAKKFDSNVIVEIKDSGVGIDKEDTQNVFKQFFQSDAGKDRSNSGLGLGLALVKSIVELHGGEISIHSEGKNKGTSVTISLPLTSVTTKSVDDLDKDVRTDESDLSLSNKRFLLVEDTLHSARFIKIYLEKKGASVEWLSNAKDALSILENEKFDFILSDIGLPEMDGLEFVINARRIKGCSTIPIFAISAYGSKDEVKRSLNAGFDEHLVKPVKLSELLEKIIDRFS